MRIVIAGGHGQIALRLEKLLGARGDQAVGLIRNPAHAADLAAIGATPVLCDLEQTTPADLAVHLSGADAVVFAAGAGPGSGPGRKDSVDRAAAALLADAAQQAGVRRYLMVSTRGAGRPPRAGTDAVWGAYVQAKTAADDYVRGSALDWTILRPGALSDQPGTGLVRLTVEPEAGAIARDDVAALLVALLDTPATRGQIWEAVNGATGIVEAVAAAAVSRGPAGQGR